MIRIEEEYNFTFTFQPNRVFEVLNSNSEYPALLQKWGLLPDSQLLCFRFDQHYHRGMRQSFVTSFFKSEAVREHFLLSNGRGDLTVPIPSVPRLTPTDIRIEELSCVETSLDMFDRLLNNEIVREPLQRDDDNDDDDASSGNTGAANNADDDDDTEEGNQRQHAVQLPIERVCQMMDVYLPCGITVSDQLRGVFMLGEESEFHGTFNEEEKKEFLYHIMWRLCTGGALNQWEDNFSVYRDTCRTLYKDVVCVGRNDDDDDGDVSSEGGDEGRRRLAVLSHVVSVESVEGVPLFPRDDMCYPSNGNYCYLVINPSRKEVIVWYHGFWSTF